MSGLCSSRKLSSLSISDQTPHTIPAKYPSATPLTQWLDHPRNQGVQQSYQVTVDSLHFRCPHEDRFPSNAIQSRRLAPSRLDVDHLPYLIIPILREIRYD